MKIESEARRQYLTTYGITLIGKKYKGISATGCGGA
jgi:hypothetical protein